MQSPFAIKLPSLHQPQHCGANVCVLPRCTPLFSIPPEEINDPDHYVPAWTYNPEDGRGRKAPISKEQAMAELAEVVGSIRPDNFDPRIVKQTSDYLYAEFQSPTFGFIDDVEVRPWLTADAAAAAAAAAA
jgi:hypothetical protein